MLVKLSRIHQGALLVSCLAELKSACNLPTSGPNYPAASGTPKRLRGRFDKNKVPVSGKVNLLVARKNYNPPMAGAGWLEVIEGATKVVPVSGSFRDFEQVTLALPKDLATQPSSNGARF